MTSILKHDPNSSDTSVRALDWNNVARAESDAVPFVNPEIAALRAEVQRLDEELLEMKAGEPERIAAAREDGRKAAERTLKANDEAKLGALRAGLEAALETASPVFANVERLALLLTERALANAFDDPGHYGDQIASAIRRQSALLGAQAVMNVEVSRADFADEAALSELSRLLQFGGGVVIDAKAELQSGQARLRLMLGEVEINLPRYWTDLKALLSNLSREAAP